MKTRWMVALTQVVISSAAWLSLPALSAADAVPSAAAVTPPPPASPVLPEGVTVLRDVAYVTGGGPARTLDLYLPAKSDHPVPLVVWIHGGWWRSGNKENPRALALLKHGYAVASINYRLVAEAIHPAQIHDCKAAIRYLRSIAAAHQINPERIGVWGASAGGHLVALLGTSGGVAALEGSEGVTGPSSRVQAVCDWYGPGNLLTMGGQYDPAVDRGDPLKTPEAGLLGGLVADNQAKATEASPIHHLSADDAPILIMHGDKDGVVPLAQSQELYAALKQAGLDATLLVIPGAGHGGKLFNTPEVDATVTAFFDRHLKR